GRLSEVTRNDHTLPDRDRNAHPYVHFFGLRLGSKCLGYDRKHFIPKLFPAYRGMKFHAGQTHTKDQVLVERVGRDLEYLCCPLMREDRIADALCNFDAISRRTCFGIEHRHRWLSCARYTRCERARDSQRDGMLPCAADDAGVSTTGQS